MLSRFLIASSLAVAAITPAVMLAPAASAVTPTCGKGYECADYYYSNGQHTKEVGYRITDCNGQVSTGGRTTIYIEFQLTACPPGGN
jgi:hypothetical protein